MGDGTGRFDRRTFLRTASGLGMALAAPAAVSSKALSDEIPSDITDLSASQLSHRIRARDVSCVEVMQAYLDRISRVNPAHNAIVSMPEHDELVALKNQLPESQCHCRDHTAHGPPALVQYPAAFWQIQNH